MIHAALPPLKIRDHILNIPIFQGGMGVGISLAPLAGAVARCGGGGTISSAAIDRMMSFFYNQKMNTRDAMAASVRDALHIAPRRGMIGVNIMRYIDRYYADSVLGAIDGGAHFIASGAGLPLELPKIAGSADIALIPIVSSVRALQNICKRWKRMPDAVIVEGPLAGGHLGFKYDDIFTPAYQLEVIFPPIKEFAQKNDNFPVIVAGGIRISEIPHWILHHGADGVQLGTVFLASHESSANATFKNIVTKCTPADVVIAMAEYNPPGSPSHMPFRIIKQSPMFYNASAENVICNLGYVLQKDKETGQHNVCPTKIDPLQHFCICNGLLAATDVPTDKKPLWTVGARAGEITEILSVDQIMDRIIASFD